MGRIPNHEIERLKKEVPRALVTGFGIELNRHGANLVQPVSFHDDREPSLVITLDKNL